MMRDTIGSSSSIAALTDQVGAGLGRSILVVHSWWLSLVGGETNDSSHVHWLLLPLVADVTQ